ncbi:hypothetical protein [Bombilactobacillus apium]|uniref:hypothetical protein n=1 Tax=Bombilactobacillus apium TaxID=2675299 RepID=UPI0038995496
MDTEQEHLKITYWKEIVALLCTGWDLSLSLSPCFPTKSEPLWGEIFRIQQSA